VKKEEKTKMNIRNKKAVLVVSLGMLAGTLVPLTQAGWCGEKPSKQETVPNQSGQIQEIKQRLGNAEEIEELKRRLSQLEYQRELERRITKLETEMPKKHKLEIGRVEIGASIAMPQEAKVEKSKLALDSGLIYAGHIGFNVTNWLQLGLEVGRLELKWKERSGYSTSYSNSITNRDVTTDFTYITPRIRFQGYLGNYVQPFLSFGAGPAVNQFTVAQTHTYSSSYGSYRSNYSYSTKYSGKDSGLMGNANMGLCIGKKSSPVKVNGAVRIDADENFYVISPSLGLVVSW
jgi:hypothetical protein